MTNKKPSPAPPAIRKLYAKTVRLARKQAFINERRANKKKAHKQAKAEKRKSIVMTRSDALNKQIDKIEKAPTVLGVQLLRQIAVSDKTPGAVRVRAAAVLLKIGGISDDRQVRRGSKAAGP